MSRFQIFLLFSAFLIISAVFARAATQGDPTSNVGMLSYTPSGYGFRGPENAPCKKDVEGAMRYSPRHKALLLCDGVKWMMVQTAAIPNGK